MFTKKEKRKMEKLKRENKELVERLYVMSNAEQRQSQMIQKNQMMMILLLLHTHPDREKIYRQMTQQVINGYLKDLVGFKDSTAIPVKAEVRDYYGE